MSPHKASTPRRGGEAWTGMSVSGTANPQSQPDASTTEKAGRTSKRFDNDTSKLVGRRLKTTHAYRLVFRLPKSKLQQFPKYDGRVKDFSHRWIGSFVTLKIPARRLQAISKQQDFPTTTILPPPPATLQASATAPSLLSAGSGDVSEVDTGPATSNSTLPWLGDRSTNPAYKAVQQEFPVTTTGHFKTHDQDRLPSTLLAPYDNRLPRSIGTESAYEDVPRAVRLSQNNNMAPVKDTSKVHNTIKDVIQHLTDVQYQTHGYIPATQVLLVDKLTDLTQSLAELKRLTSLQESPNSYIHQVAIAPEIIDYVDDGRNPDIFTRDFVENVQRGNSVINGKQQAFRDFTEIFAEKLKEGIPGVSGQVDRVLHSVGIEEGQGSRTNGIRHLEEGTDMPSNG